MGFGGPKVGMLQNRQYDFLVGSLEVCYFFGSRLQMLKCMWNLPLQKHRWKFKTQWFIGGCSEMPFLGNYWRFRRFTLFLFLAACRIAGAILWSKLCEEQILSFLFWEQCPLTYRCLSHPKFRHPTGGLSDVSYMRSSFCPRFQQRGFRTTGIWFFPWIS